MSERAEQIIKRLIDYADPSERKEIEESIKQFEIVKINRKKVVKKKDEIWETLLVRPWSFNFIFGKIGEPAYDQLVDIISHPAAVMRTRFISGGLNLQRKLNVLIIFGHILQLVGLILIIMFFVNLYFILLGLLCWAVWWLIFSNFQTIINVETMARIMVYDEIAENKEKGIILEIQD